MSLSSLHFVLELPLALEQKPARIWHKLTCDWVAAHLLILTITLLKNAQRSDIYSELKTERRSLATSHRSTTDLTCLLHRAPTGDRLCDALSESAKKQENPT